MCFFFSYFSAVRFKLIVKFPTMTFIKKTDCPLLQKEFKRTMKTVNLETKILLFKKMEAGEKSKLKLYVII
jgi:hypothetical protein